MRGWFLVCHLSAACALAQTLSTTGAIEGRVTDPAGAAVAGVRVRAAQTGAGIVRFTETGDGGEFRMTGLPIGTYTLRLEREGFASIRVEEFPVSVGQTVMHRLRMELAQVNERLEVRERPDSLETTAVSASVALGGERIEESPAQNRNYLNFVMVAPAVTPSAGSNAQRSFAGPRSPVTDSGFSFAGMRGRNNSLLIDGMDNRDETTGGIRVGIGLEMVQEFRVSSTAASAEFGGAAGGLVNVVTRSGTNLWHGDATLFVQSGRFNARNPEVDPGLKPRFRRIQPGLSINGPWRKDRTFFSTAVEHESDRGQEWSDTPPAHLAAINRALGGPEFERAGVRQVSRGLFDSSAEETEFSFKLNHQMGDRHTFSSRYALSRANIGSDVQGVDNFGDRSSRGSSLTLDQSIVANWMAVYSARLVHDLRGQIARRRTRFGPNSGGAMLEIPGLLTMGQSYRMDSGRTEDHYQISDSLSYSRGRHQMGAGAELHTVRLNAAIANRFGGIFLFPTLDDFLTGKPDVYIQAFGRPDTRLRTTPTGIWLQDRWQPLSNLTLETGLRMDRQRMPEGIPSAGWNGAPRIGLAWHFHPAYVLRTSYGFFYDRYPLAFLNDAVQKDGSRGFEQYLAGAAAAEAFRLGRGGPLAKQVEGQPISRYQASPSFPTTHSQKLSVGVEHSFGKETTLSAEYGWVRGFHLPRIRNAAVTLPPLYQLEQTARSEYHGVSIALNRRMSRELTYLIAYHGGRTRDDASDFDEHPMNPANTRLDWALSRQHQAHRLVASALFEFPAEDMGGLPAWLKETLEKLVIGPVVSMNGGRPLNALDSRDSLRTGAYPISARPVGLARNPYFSPSTFSMNLRVLKGFPVRDGRAILQIGLEAFNLTNHSNALRVSPYIGAGASRLATYGRPIETMEARQFQLVAQFEY